jgi:hypothetical protein
MRVSSQKNTVLLIVRRNTVQGKQKEVYTSKNLFYKYYWTYGDVLYTDWTENSQSYVHTLQALDLSPTCDAGDIKLIIQLFPHCT